MEGNASYPEAYAYRDSGNAFPVTATPKLKLSIRQCCQEPPVRGELHTSGIFVPDLKSGDLITRKQVPHANSLVI